MNRIEYGFFYKQGNRYKANLYDVNFSSDISIDKKSINNAIEINNKIGHYMYFQLKEIKPRNGNTPFWVAIPLTYDEQIKQLKENAFNIWSKVLEVGGLNCFYIYYDLQHSKYEVTLDYKIKYKNIILSDEEAAILYNYCEIAGEKIKKDENMCCYSYYDNISF